MAGDEQQRILRFPFDRSLGWLAARAPEQAEEDEWQHIGEASGLVTVPQGTELRLIVEPEAATDLSWLADLRPDDLQQLFLVQTRVTDEQLAYVGILTELELLTLSDTEITDDGLAHLHSLTRLKRLYLWSARHISDAGLVYLRPLTSLEVLSLGRTQVTDAGLGHLSQVRSLREARLEKTHVSDAGRAMLVRMRPDLQILL